MIFLINLAKYSKLLFTAVLIFIALQLYYTVQFARVSRCVDHDKPLPHPIAFEAFPFVVYNMYSGKMTDWHNYIYYRFEADGSPVAVTDLHFFESEQLINPFDKYLMYEPAGFNQEPLHSFLIYELGEGPVTEHLYDKVSNHGTADCSNRYGRWLTWYLSGVQGKTVHGIKIFGCHYNYNGGGKAEKLDEKLVFEYHD